MGLLSDYLTGLSRIHRTGEAVEETSYYGQLETLLNGIGSRVSPRIVCVLTARNQGAGIPDGGRFLLNRALQRAGRDVLLSRAPERGVIEAKGASRDIRRVARTQQVRRYLDKYGKVLVTTYREFLVVSLDSDGKPTFGETFSIASDETDFWRLAGSNDPVSEQREAEFEGYLR